MEEAQASKPISIRLINVSRDQNYFRQHIMQNLLKNINKCGLGYYNFCQTFFSESKFPDKLPSSKLCSGYSLAVA